MMSSESFDWELYAIVLLVVLFLGTVVYIALFIEERGILALVVLFLGTVVYIALLVLGESGRKGMKCERKNTEHNRA